MTEQTTGKPGARWQRLPTAFRYSWLGRFIYRTFVRRFVMADYTRREAGYARAAEDFYGDCAWYWRQRGFDSFTARKKAREHRSVTR